MVEGDPMSRDEIRAEMERARATFRRLLDEASDADMKSRSRGTRWTNQQLLFHMLFGYLIVQTLRRLVRVFGVLPESVSLVYARLLNAASRPFHAINYWGSRGGAVVFGRDRMGRKMDRVICSLQRNLGCESDAALARRMHFPVRWDPFFTEVMTLGEVYHYATQHFEFHREQLTLHGGVEVGRREPTLVRCACWSLITCPLCGAEARETMPTDACQHFYRGTGCSELLKPGDGNCCVFCSFPLHAPKQGETDERDPYRC